MAKVKSLIVLLLNLSKDFDVVSIGARSIKMRFIDCENEIKCVGLD